ncbi:histidine phosphatase family protein [Paenibacillus contaminans]|uniref:Histidine phosphatase family protein n=1 Tax=Paenibacillus contaminans TaxID=450362 RepID=A0A329MKT3_9BACL|nr:histidine phosphatase family protein [Paenibacillus contaminans]RAV20459.1 histidine phosphatase family protein [Paenibacillus contaminans]
MRIYIIRHADPDYANHTITAAGHKEAKALAERLKLEGIDRIFSSPVPRAVHTMQYTSRLLEIEPVFEPWMAELEGWHVTGEDGQSRAAWNVDGEIVRGLERRQVDEWHRFGPFAGGDFHSKNALLTDNSDRFMQSLGYAREGGRYRIIKRNGDKIAVFCHLGFGLTWISHLLGLPVPTVWTGFWKAPSSVTTLLMDERSEQWAVPRLLALGDTSHLHASGLPISKQGIFANFD